MDILEFLKNAWIEFWYGDTYGPVRAVFFWLLIICLVLYLIVKPWQKNKSKQPRNDRN
jgi:hypothetical protein